KNVELKALATRVADAFLRRLDSLAPDSATSRAGRRAAVRDLLASAAYPTVVRAARSISRALQRMRRRAAEMRNANEHGEHIKFFDIIARECMVEAQRILAVLEDIEDLVQSDRSSPSPSKIPAPPGEDDET